MKYTVITPICVLTLFLYETETSFLWSNDPTFNKYKSTAFKVEENAQSLIECSTFCQRMPACLAFIYFQQTCQLLERLLTTISGLIALENAKYFVMGYVDPDGFRTVALSTKSLFTYKIITDPLQAITDAQGICELLDSNLVRINSRAKLDHLIRVIQTSTRLRRLMHFYVGGYFDGNDVRFSNGEIMPAELLMEGFPDNTPIVHCLQLWKYIGWNIDDTVCFRSKPFIFEK